MWLRNTSSYPDDDVRQLVELATSELDMRHVCVNVKGGASWSGHAYNGVPSISNAPPSAKYLITIRLPKDVGDITYNERRRTRFPVYRTHDWRELLIVVAAHEGKHIEQFREGLRHSEVRCEWYARYMLSRHRGEKHKAQTAPSDLSLVPAT